MANKYKNYTRLDNEVFDFMISGTVRGAELEVLWFLIRHTVGFRRESTKASYGFIAKGMHCSTSKAKRAIKSLIKKGYVKIISPAHGVEPQVVKLDYSKMTIVNSDHRVWSDSTTECGQDRLGRNDHQEIIDIEIKDINKRIKENLTPEEEERMWQEQLEEDDDDLQVLGYGC